MSVSAPISPTPRAASTRANSAASRPTRGLARDGSPAGAGSCRSRRAGRGGAGRPWVSTLEGHRRMLPGTDPGRGPPVARPRRGCQPERTGADAPRCRELRPDDACPDRRPAEDPPRGQGDHAPARRERRRGDDREVAQAAGRPRRQVRAAARGHHRQGQRRGPVAVRGHAHRDPRRGRARRSRTTPRSRSSRPRTPTTARQRTAPRPRRDCRPRPRPRLHDDRVGRRRACPGGQPGADRPQPAERPSRARTSVRSRNRPPCRWPPRRRQAPARRLDAGRAAPATRTPG